MRIFSIVLLLILSSCYTDRKATKQVIKAHAIKPSITANLCSSFYPVKDSIIKETKFIEGKKDTVTNLVTDTLINNDTVKIINTVYRYINRTDTVNKTHIQYRESTSKLKDLSYKLTDLKLLKSANNEKIKQLKKSRNNWRMYLILFISLYLGKIIITKRI